MMSRKFKFTAGFLAFIAALPLAAQQQQANAPKQSDTLFSNPVFNIMLSIVILLLVVIYAMTEVVKAGAARQRAQAKKEKTPASGSTLGLFLLFFLSAATLHAQNTTAAAPSIPLPPAPPFNYWGMGAGIFYLMLVIIFSEILIAWLLFRSGMLLIRPDVSEKDAVQLKKEPSFLEKINASVAVEQEAAIMMDHDYDGIRELDNNLPPWWKYGFYLTIIVAVVYLFNYHVFHTGKLSLEEYEQEMKDGAAAVAEYQKNATDLVDENTVKLLTDAASLADGKTIFKQNCAACHGPEGQGLVGPNFTDDYWLHGGSVNDVFRSVKYGWTEKGMKSWQQDLKPAEIQLVVSYVKSLRGTNPPNAKEKQGELYIEEGEKPLGDSLKTDSLKPAVDSAVQK